MGTLLIVVGFLMFGIGLITLITKLFMKRDVRKLKFVPLIGAALFMVGGYMAGTSSTEKSAETTQSSQERDVAKLESESKEESSEEESESLTAEEKAAAESESIAKAESESIAKEEARAKAESESIAKAESEQAAAESRAAELAAATAPVTLSGTGDIVTDTFKLRSNHFIINASDNGYSNFIVKLHGVNGTEYGSLVNEIGPYSGQQFASLSPGEYRLEVMSEGYWEVTFDPNIPTEGQQSPLSGSGDTVVFLEIAAGNYVLNASDTGSSNFIVRVNDSNTLVNEIGPYSGQSMANFRDSGLYAIQVISEGDWTLDFTK